MLFDSKSKADNFIRFNKDVILEQKGVAPVRSYYCEFCCGYHVTSNPSVKSGEKLDEIKHKYLVALTSSSLSNPEFNKYFMGVLNEVDNAESFMYAGDFRKIRSLYKQMKSLRIRHKILPKLSSQRRERFEALEKKISIFYDISLKANEIVKGDQEALIQYLSEQQSSDDNDILAPLLKGLRLTVVVVKQIEYILHTLENEEDFVKANERKEELRQYVRSAEASEARVACNKRINELEQTIAKKRREKEAQNSEVKETPIISSQVKRLNKSTMLEVIQILEEIKDSYDEGDIEACETKLEVADFIFGDITLEDSNTALIKSYIENWRMKLNESREL